MLTSSESRGRERAESGRRWFLSIAVAEPGGAFRELPAVREDVARLRSRFLAMGYELGPSLHDPCASSLRTSIEGWLAVAPLGFNDSVVVYYSGHGIISDTEHYLVTRGLDSDQTGVTGLKTTELIEMILRRKSRPGKLWLILDCCQAGGVLTPGLIRALAPQGGGVFLLASSGSWGQAIDGAFSTALDRALADMQSLGLRPPSLDELAAGLNDCGLRSQVVQASVSTSRFDFVHAAKRGKPNETVFIGADRSPPRRTVRRGEWTVLGLATVSVIATVLAMTHPVGMRGGGLPIVCANANECGPNASGRNGLRTRRGRLTQVPDRSEREIVGVGRHKKPFRTSPFATEHGYIRGRAAE